jgi:hypothetical protein
MDERFVYDHPGTISDPEQERLSDFLTVQNWRKGGNQLRNKINEILAKYGIHDEASYEEQFMRSLKPLVVTGFKIWTAQDTGPMCGDRTK